MTRDEFIEEFMCRARNPRISDCASDVLQELADVAADLFWELTQCRKCNGDGIRMLLGPGEHKEHERKPYECQECDGTGSQLK